jgi:hypothetical protein
VYLLVLAGGLANYNGDLLDKLYHKKLTNGFIGLTVHYELQDQILIRGSYNFARVNGSDIYSEKEYLRMRNLHFESAYIRVQHCWRILFV